MSVVKKYQSGGTSPNLYEDYEDFINKKFGEGILTAKAEQPAREAASNWGKLIKSGSLEQAYQYDPITQKYKIDASKLPTELQSIDWTGSEEGIKTNIFGQVTPKSNVNTLIANWTNEYLQNKKSTQGSDAQKKAAGYLGKKKIGDLGLYIQKSVYGGQEGAENLWAQDLATFGEDESAKKKRVMDIAKKYVSEYGTTPKEGWEYLPVENKEIILKAIENNDWDTFVSESQKLGWNPRGLLLPKSEEQIKQESQQAKQNELEGFIKNLRQQGYADSVIADAVEKGFTKISADNRLKNIDSPWLQEDISKKGLVLEDESGRQIVIGKTGLFESTYIDPDAPGYGTYFSHIEGIPTLFQEGVEGYDPSMFQYSADGKKYRPIEGKVSGYAGWNIYGVPVRGEKGFNYLNNLILIDPQTNKEVELVKQGDVYKRIDTGEVIDVDISKFGKEEPGFEPMYLRFQQLGSADLFSKLPQLNPTTNASEILTISEELVKKPIDRNYYKEAGQVLAQLKYIANNDPSYINRNNAANRYIEIMSKVDTANNPNKLIQQILDAYIQRRKVGGIINRQSGGTLSTQAYLDKYAKKPEEQKTEKEKPSDIRGTLADADFLDWVSMGGAASSILPGVGAIGAGVTAIADIARDIRGDDVGMGTHLTNLAFIGLSAVGFGGLRTLGAGVKAAKAAGKLPQLVKIADKADDVKKFTSAVDKIAKVGDEKMSYKAIGLLDDEFKLLKEAGIISPKASISTIIKKGTNQKASQVLSKNLAPAIKPIGPKPLNIPLAKAPTEPGVLKRALLIETSGMRNLAKYLPTAPRILQAGKLAATGLGLGTVGYSGAKVIGGAVSDGAEGIQTSDVRNLLYGLGGARGYFKTMQPIRHGRKLLTSAPTDKATIQLGDTSAKLTKEISLPKLKTSKLGWKKEKIEEFNKKEIESFKKTLEDTLEDKAMFSKFKDLEDLKDIKITAPGKSTFVPFEKSGLTRFEYDRAMKALKGEIGNYFTPAWYASYKQGGILKAQQGTGFLKWVAAKNQSKIDPSIQIPEYGLPNLLKVAGKRNAERYLSNLPRKNIPTSTDNYFDYRPDRERELTEQSTQPVNNKVSIYQVTKDDMNVAERKMMTPPEISNRQMAMRSGNNWYLSGDQEPGVFVGDKFVYRTNVPLSVEGKPINQSLMFRPQSGSDIVRNRRINLGDIKSKLPNINETDLLNVVGYGKTIQANKAIAESQKRAALAGILKLPTIAPQYFRASSTLAPFYDTQAAKLSSVGKRMAGSIADIDKGFAARLTAEGQGAGLREKGVIADQQQIQQTLERQDQSNRQTQLANLETMVKNMASAAEGERALHLVDANKMLANNAAFQNLIQGYAQNKQIKERDKKYSDYYAAMTDPEYRAQMKEAQQIQEAREKAKQAWSQDDSDETVTTFEESQAAKEFDARLNRIREYMENYQYNLRNLGLAMQMPGSVSYRAKGGSLSEKKELARYKSELSRTQKDVERIYKTILKNNELMQKSLLKIFK